MLPDASGPHDVSVSERALLTLHELSGRSGGYNLRCALTMAADADLSRVQTSIEMLFSRHPLLRSRFVVDGLGFHRYVRGPGPFLLTVIPLAVRDLSERDAFIARRSLRPFELEHEDPARFELLEVRACDGARERILLITVHHVAADYASVQLIVAELEQIYQALERDGGIPELGVTARFDERVRKERVYLASPRAQQDSERWASALLPLPAALHLPGARSRPARPRFVGLELRTRIAPTLTQAVRALARSLAVTPYLIALAACSALLALAAQRDELMLGTTVDSDGDRLRFGGVGYFVNPLPLRLFVPRAQPFASLVAETRRSFARSLSLGRLPFASLVERLALARDAAVPPIFQAMVTWLKFAPEFIHPPTPGRLLLEVVELSGVQPAAVTHDLVLSIEDRESYLACAWAFDDVVLPRHLVERLAGSFEGLLGALVEHPHAPIERAAARVSLGSSDTVHREQLEL